MTQAIGLKHTLPKNQALKYFDYIVGLFVAVLIISNIVSTKLVGIGPFVLDGGTFLFPLAYIFGDIFTEVYGYGRARRAIWTGFAALVLLTVTLILVQFLPSAHGWNNQAAYTTILGFVPRIVISSICGYLAGEFVNSYVMAKMKLFTNGKYLWTRTVGSTIAGEGVDTIVFSTIAFYGVISNSELLNLIGTIYVAKVAVEIIFTPITYRIVHFLKQHEGVDVYDTKTDFTPFALDATKVKS